MKSAQIIVSRIDDGYVVKIDGCCAFFWRAGHPSFEALKTSNACEGDG